MRTEGRAASAVTIMLSAAALLWPALWNGYPLVFADTGTYVSQAIEHYVGWDRPVFYSLFLLPLHLTITTWPAIAVQALLVAHTLHLVRRTLLPAISAWWLFPIVAFLSIATALPWFASQLVPDVFTALLVLALSLLVFIPERLSRGECIWLVIFAAFMIAAHQSHVPLALVLLLVLLPLRHWLGAATPLGRRGLMTATAPLVLAAIAMLAANIACFGRASLSPYGNVFILTRIIYDGPGMEALRRECPQAGWKLCAFVDAMPSDSDDFLWREDGPVIRSGGAKLVSADADKIILAALRADAGTELRAFVNNARHQLIRFASGDGLQPWPITVTPVILRDFPRSEATAYAASRQTQGTLSVPPWLRTLHITVAILGVLVCCVVLPIALVRRHVIAGFTASLLLALLANAIVTGGFSSIQDRYQSRIMWLPPLFALLAIAAITTRLRPSWAAEPVRKPVLAAQAGNVLWSGFEVATAATLSFASAFLVARLVGPSEVGIGAAVIAVHVLLWVAVNALFADPLVQRATMDEAVFSSAFCASVAVGGVAALVQVAVAHPIAWWLGDSRLIAMSALLALPLPLVGAAGPIQGLLTRNRNYKALATRTLIGQGLGTICGVAAALAGAGAWAIVLQQFVVSSAGAVTLLVQSPARPRWIVRAHDLRDLLRIGLPLTASTFVQLGRYRLFALLIGGTAGAAALGQVHMAFRLVDTMRELGFTAQWRLMLPVMSERQDDLPALQASTDRCLAWSSLIAFPLCGAMALCVQPLVQLLLGPVWQPAGFAALPLIGLSAWLFLAFPAGVAVIARGVPRCALIGNIAGTAATIFGVILLRPAAPIHAVLLWLGAQLVVTPYMLWANARVLHTSPLRPLHAGLPMLAATGLATLVAFVVPYAMGEPVSPVSLIALRLLIAIMVGVPIAMLLTPRTSRSAPSGPSQPGSGKLGITGSDPRGPNAQLRL